MKKTDRIYAFLAVIATIVFITSCSEDTTEQDSRDDEQRYFDIYVAANYPEIIKRSNTITVSGKNLLIVK